MNDTEVDVIDVEEVESIEDQADAPEDRADVPDRMEALVERFDQLLVVADQVIELLQQLTTNTAKPERVPLPPKASGAGDAPRKSIYNM